MDFESAEQRAAYARLRGPLEELFPEGLRERIHAIGYVMTVDGTIVTSTLAPWGEGDTIVANRVYLAGAVPMSVELLRELARWSSDARFGAYGVDDADNVYFEHQLVGSTVNAAVLERSIRSSLALASARRDEVRQRFGGGDI